MTVKKIAVTDGVNLNIVATDKFKTNYISVNFLTALSKESVASNALFPMLLKRGTVSYPTMASINERLDRLYASTTATRTQKQGEASIVKFMGHMLNNRYALDNTDIQNGVIDMLREMIFEPVTVGGVFLPSYLEGEKRNLTDAINSVINNKTAYAIWRCKEEMCRGELYGIPEYGTVSDVANITSEGLFNHYKKTVATAPVEIYFVGNCDEAALADKMKDIFKDMPRKAVAVTTDVRRRADRVKEIKEEQPVSQSKLSVGFRTGTVLSDGDYFKFALFNELYGVSPTSRLFMNVREKLSLCYYCRSIPDPQKGLLIVASGIESVNKEKAQNEILLQLDSIKNGEITEHELSCAKKSLINSYREISDSPMSIEQWYMGRAAAGLSDSPEEAAQAVMDVTVSDITDMARKMTLDTVYFMQGTKTGGNEDE